MKRFIVFGLFILVVCVAWCGIQHNFMDVDNTNAEDDLKYYIWNWNTSEINSGIDGLSWARNSAKWYADKYYEDNLKWYVDSAKEWLSWTIKELKWYYNSGVDQLNWVITDKVNGAISWELNKFKIK